MAAKCYPIVLTVFFLLSPVPVLAEVWDALHREMLPGLAELSRGYFAGASLEDATAAPAVPVETSLPRDSIVVVGFTGGIEKKDSRASGIAGIRKRLEELLEQESAVLPVTFNNMRWRRARTEVLRIVQDMRQDNGSSLRQPLLIVYGHSWGGGSIGKFARALQREGVEISLAIYIDAFTWRGAFAPGSHPKVPANVRYAINFYQRAGIFRGLPMRGKSKLIPENEETTCILGNFKITPQTEAWGWNWRNPLQPLLYRQHHRIAHDRRLESFLVDLVAMKLNLLNLAQSATPLAPASLRSLTTSGDGHAMANCHQDTLALGMQD